MLIALCGKPSVGKSTFFKAATLANVEIANYPFTTLKSTEGVAFARVDCVDKEFNVKCNPRLGFCLNGKRFIPVKLMDIPGLIEGSYQGLGRGNEFLSDIAMGEALLHIIDISGSTNEKGEAVEPLSYDPCNDVAFLEHEIDMWVLGMIKKGWEKFSRSVKQENTNIYKALAKQLSGIRVTEDLAKNVVKELSFSESVDTWSDEDLKHLAVTLRKFTKPIVIVANKIDVIGAEKNLERLKQKFPSYLIIPCSADSELALREASKSNLIKYVPGDSNFEIIGNLNPNQSKALEYIKENVLKKYGNTGVQDILDKVVFDVLKMVAIFPGGVNKLEDKDGNVLPDCFLMKEGTTALDFAYRLHSSIGDGFIRAIDVKTKRTVGKEHVLKNRDVVEIVAKC
jgi:ribosome-binding ATPase YchF (GTP1/OBG family)